MSQPYIEEAAGLERLEFIQKNEAVFNAMLCDVEDKKTLKQSASAKYKQCETDLKKMVSNVQRVVFRNKNISLSVKKAFGYGLKFGRSYIDFTAKADIILNAWQLHKELASSAGVMQWQIDTIATRRKEIVHAKAMQQSAIEKKKEASALKNKMQRKLGEKIYELSNIGTCIFFELNPELCKQFQKLGKEKRSKQ